MGALAAAIDLGDLPALSPGGLRPELELRSLDPDPDGSPAWILVDPLAGRFYRLGVLEVELLRLVPLGDARRMAEEASRQAGRPVGEDMVKEFLDFLGRQNLLRVTGDEGRARLARLHEQAGRWNIRKLTQGWISVRLRILRPDRFLTKGLPLARWWFGRWALALAALAGGTGLVLALRQLDAFFATFSFLFSVEGMLLYMVTLTGLKALHELGHAFACKLHGCRVPSMGVAFLVLWPVLYTDTTEAWKLPSRRARLAIGFAGMRTELMVAGFALLLWSLLPDGPLRSICFFLSTTAVVLTLVINMNPLMKFDGYYLFSDWLRFPNLQERTYALARWWLRRTVFGLRQEPPEAPRAGLIAFGAATWLYRLGITLGIALLVYGFVFKALGILLALAVLWWSLVWPVAKELHDVARTGGILNRRAVATFGAALALMGLIIVPWRGAAELPAALGTESVSRLYAVADGRIAEIGVANGDMVERGQHLMRIETPDLAAQLADSERQVESLRWQLSSQGLDRALLDRSMVLAAELRTALSRRNGLREQMERAQAVAPAAGRIVDLPDHLRVGDWIGEGTYLASIAAAQPADLVGYAAEDQMRRIEAGAGGLFYLKGQAQGRPVPVRVVEVETTGLRELDQPFMASVHGGEIAVREAADGQLVPVQAVYRLRLRLEGDVGPVHHVSVGTVRIEAEKESILGAFWRRSFGILRRELSF